jgi:hypothetical protein
VLEVLGLPVDLVESFRILGAPGPEQEALGLDDLGQEVVGYFATSIARDSRMTITFTWPGYSS